MPESTRTTSVHRSFQTLQPAAWAIVIKWLLLDCDGTLVDSDPIIEEEVSRAVTAALRSNGQTDFAHTVEQNKLRFRGFTFAQILATLALEQGVSLAPDEAASLHDAYEIEKCRALRLRARAAPGCADTLSKLRQSGLQLALVSSSSFAAIDACLHGAGLSEFFPQERIFSAADSLGYYSAKPDPAIYEFALRQLGSGEGQACAGEDSGSGIRAAVAAGLPVFAYGGCVAADEQEAHWQKCLALGAMTYLRHWSELPNMLGI